MEESETLITKFLMVVQEIYQSIDALGARLSAIEQQLHNIVSEAFVDSDPKKHKVWHESNQLPKWRKWLIRVLG